MTFSPGTLTVICIAFAAVTSNLVAENERPAVYSRVITADSATVWQACLEQAKDAQGHRIEAGHNPYVVWLFFDFGDTVHPMSELADYADSADALGNRYGRAEIKLTVNSVSRGHTQISGTGFFEGLSLPTAAAYLPLRSKGILERKIVDSIAQRIGER
ncbi:MAG TPA: hypothetical protein VK673_06900 [Chthoniobacterales bacterium]|nr:hypothetical protein [Chthoniobacterales bacterium]